jgi:iron complex transport system ATP-binding protein
VRYDRNLPVVIDGQSIAIPEGRITALIGPNGSGKSTLLKTLARQLAPDAGQVVLDGRDIASLSRLQFARRVGMLFQENVAPTGLTVEDLVYHGRYGHRRLFESFTPEDRAAVEHALRMADIEHLRHRPVGRLSSGQKQLAWIAMALAQETQYLFLDEPTTFLDLAHQFEVMDLIHKLNRELRKTIVLVVHDLNLAARYADCIFALRAGRIAASGTPAEVLTVATLRQVFDVEARIIRDEQSNLFFCLPVGKAVAADP